MRATMFFPIALLFTGSCMNYGAAPGTSSRMMIPAGPGAGATVHDASGRMLGMLTIVETGGHLTMVGTLRGLPPGSHGIHLHAVGRCDAPGFTTAGGHWNPGARQHGFENPLGSHMGDMRNVVVGDDSIGTVNASTMSGVLRGDGGAMDADGLAIVVHAMTDDYRTEPSGNSGARIACGVVTP